MTEQSQFSKLPKKQLVFICEKLMDEDFPIGNPYEQDFDHAYNTLQDVSKYFNIEVTHEDYGNMDFGTETQQLAEKGFDTHPVFQGSGIAFLDRRPVCNRIRIRYTQFNDV